MREKNPPMLVLGNPGGPHPDKERKRVGDRVRVVWGSGIQSNVVATVVPPFDWRLEQGAYKPVPSGYAYLKGDDGNLFTMPLNRLSKVSERGGNPPMLVLGNPGRKMSKLEQEAAAAGLYVTTYSPGDGQTRYRFFKKPSDYSQGGHFMDRTIYGRKAALNFVQLVKQMEGWYGPVKENPPMLVLGNPKSGPADSTAAEELELFITNDADLYRQQFWPIVKNLMHRQMKGDFDFEKSVKLWGYFVDNGAKKYVKEHGTPGQKIDSMFNKNTRLIVARSLANSFVTEAEYGNYDIAAEGLRWGRGGNPTKEWSYHWGLYWGYVEADNKAEALRKALSSLKSYVDWRYGKREVSRLKVKDIRVERRKGNPLTRVESADLLRKARRRISTLERTGHKLAPEERGRIRGVVQGYGRVVQRYSDDRQAQDMAWRTLVQADELKGRGGNPQIHSMDDASWKKATKAQKIHWLQNVIAYQKATTRPGVPDTMAFYWIKKYEKRLASLQRGSNPHEDGDSCPVCTGDLMSIGQLGNLEWYRCRQCGMELSQKVEDWGGTKKKSKKKVKRGKNPSELPAHIANDPAFKKELAAFHRRHGNIPVRVKEVAVPNGFPKYMSAYGEAPEAKYDAPKGSKKGKRFHIFGKKGKGRPHLASSVEKGPKFLAYVGGKFKAKTDWLYD
jgi:hypothetical protein